MFHNFGYEVSHLLKDAEAIRFDLKHPYVGTEHLLLAILHGENDVSKLLLEYNLDYATFREELVASVGCATREQEINLYTPMLKQVIELALMDANENNKGVVTPTHLFLSLIEEAEGVAYRILISMDLPVEEIYAKLRKKSFSKDSRCKSLEVFKIGVLLNDSVSKNEKIVGRESEMNFLIETLLRRQKNNPLLIGKAGVGKTALVEELVRRIKSHDVPDDLKNCEIVMLEMGALVSGTKYRGEFEERLHKIIKEVKDAGNIILFIDEIHTMVNAGGAEGAIAASDILKPYLARGDIKIIGATTLCEYHQFLEKDKALDRRFEKIMIEEPTNDDMKVILTSLRPSLEEHYGVLITDENISDFIACSEEYLFSKCNPDRTIELVDSVCARVKLRHDRDLKKRSPLELERVIKRKEKCVKNGDYESAIHEATLEEKLRQELNVCSSFSASVTHDDILELIEAKTHAKIRVNHKSLLKSLHDNLFANIIGQDKVLNELLDVMKCPKKKGTSFLLVGGSGVGKTETVKIINDTLQTNLIRIDMSEYSSLDSINKLLGAPSGYVGYEDTYVFESLRENPFSTILFDEIEKAHPLVLNLLLQILDEGFITDRKGNKIRFDHTFIFLTSNVVSKSTVGFAQTNMPSFEGMLSKELLGRIDKILEFQNISLDVALQYIETNLKNKSICAQDILNESDIFKYGLRNVRNLIHKYNKQLDYQES